MGAAISRDELKSKMDRHENFLLVETLDESDFARTHLPGAINLPPNHVRDMAMRRLPGKNAEIVVYCAKSASNASEVAASELEAQGYKHVRRYIEGKQDWVEAGLPTEGSRPSRS